MCPPRYLIRVSAQILGLTTRANQYIRPDILSSNPKNEIHDSIYDRKWEEHDNKSNDCKLQGTFSMFDLFGISESSGIEKGRKYDSSDSQYGSEKYELIRDTDNLSLCPSWDSIIIVWGSHRSLWFTSSKRGYWVTPIIVARGKYPRKRSKYEERTDEWEYEFFHKKMYFKKWNQWQFWQQRMRVG